MAILFTYCASIKKVIFATMLGRRSLKKGISYLKKNSSFKKRMIG
jgi:hypothetical protein